MMTDRIDHNNKENELELEPTLRGAGAGKTFNAVLAGEVHTFDAEDRAAAVRLAQQQDPGPGYFSRNYAYFWFCILVTCMCSGDQGFDGTIMSSVNSMIQYQKFFGLSEADKGTSLVFGIYTVGSVCAFFFTATLPDLLGRRKTMVVGNIFVVAGALITGLARNRSMLLGGRFLTGLSAVVQYAGAKIYMAEITSPANRGRYIGLLNSWYFIGQILASGVSIPLGRLSTNWAWRSPMLLQVVPAMINVSLALFMPESPRWLFSHGKREEAISVLARFHSKDRDPWSPIVQLEIQEIELNISLEGSDKRWWDFRPVFATANFRRRFFVVITSVLWGQLAGNGLVGYFLPVLLSQAGISSPDLQRRLNFANSVLSFAGALTGVALVDFWGRRSLMMFSTGSDCINLFIIGALLSPGGVQTAARANAGIAFIYIFSILFAFGWTPLQTIYISEIFHYEVRAKSMALTSWFIAAVGCINTFGLPVALQQIRNNIYFVFAAWNLLGFWAIYFIIAETKQLTLEDLDNVFDSSYPRNKAFEMQREAKRRVAVHRNEVIAGGEGLA